MTPEPELPAPLAEGPMAIARSAVNGVRRAAVDGAAQLVAWDLQLPEGASRMRQFIFGFWLPVVVARAVLQDPRVRARWMRFSVSQVVATVGVALLALMVGGSDGLGDDKAVNAAAQGAVAQLKGRVEDRAADLEGRAAPADRVLVREQRDLVVERLDHLVGRLEGHGVRGVPAPDELPILLSRALDDASMERAASRRAQLADAVENVDPARFREALAKKVSDQLGPLIEGKEASASTDPEPSFDLAEAKALNPRKLQQEILAQAQRQERAQATEKAKTKVKASFAVVPETPDIPEEPDEDKPAAALTQLLNAAGKPRAPAPPPTPEQLAKARTIRAELRTAALSAVPEAEAKLSAARPWSRRLAALGVSWRFLGWLVALWGALYGAQFVVIALCRDYHSELSREACLLTGIAPEDSPRTPRPRIDARWAVLRVKRQFRGWWVITLGIPVCSLAGMMFPGDSVRNALIAGWILYWQTVFAASKSQRAWVNERVAPAPWFLRGWRWICDKFFPVRLVGAGIYLAVWERSTRSLYAPAECVEQQPAPFVGLMIFRLLGSTPLIKVFTRPLIPVASALLIEAYRAKHPALAQPAS